MTEEIKNELGNTTEIKKAKNNNQITDNLAQTQVENPAPKKSRSCLWIILVLAILFFLFKIIGFFFPLAGIFGSVVNIFNPNKDAGSVSLSTSSAQIDQKLIGNWDTGCLVPDVKSNWAERHTFTINSNGTANHKRYSGASCATMATDHDDDMTLLVPSTGKVNLAYSKGISAGTTVYDIYQVTALTLKFGHGFCNCTKDLATNTFGQSENTRPVLLNDFLIYKKQ